MKLNLTIKNILKITLIGIIISQFLFFNYISSNNFYQAFIYIPIYFIYSLVYIVYNNIGLEYLLIPFILGWTFISILLYLQLNYDYYTCFGDTSEYNKNMIYKSILLLIVILYISQNTKCNLSKIAMIFILITFLQAFVQIQKDEKKNINNDEEDQDQDEDE